MSIRNTDSAQASAHPGSNSSAASVPPRISATPPDADPTKRTGRYACIAVTSEISATPGSRSGLLGHPYRLRIDFRSGRYAFCKIRGRPGELAVRLRSLVPVPRACGG